MGSSESLVWVSRSCGSTFNLPILIVKWRLSVCSVVRRFGCGKDLFLLEVGRRAISGEGLFKFKTTTPGILKTGLLKCRNFQRTNSASSVVVRPNQRSRPGEQQRATTAVDPRRVSEYVYEEPPTGNVRPQSTTYTSLERPREDTRGNAKYDELVTEPTGQRGEAHWPTQTDMCIGNRRIMYVWIDKSSRSYMTCRKEPLSRRTTRIDVVYGVSRSAVRGQVTSPCCLDGVKWRLSQLTLYFFHWQ